MKLNLFQFAAVTSIALLSSCSDSANADAITNDTIVNNIDNGTTSTTTTTTTTTTYVDLNTGETVKQNDNGRYVTESGRDVIFYIDPVQHDTFYALTGDVVNLKLTNLGQGTWQYDGKKIKIDEDDIKIEYADGTKVKIEDEEMKIKRPDGSKTKVDQDGYKDKNSEQKVKVEDDEVKIKDN